MKKQLLIATGNKGKLKEFKNFFSELSLEIISLKDLNITDEVEETGKTYRENSQKKAIYFAKLSGLPTIADDGGIEIAALNNQPGIKTKRWLGRKASDKELVNHMIMVSKALPENNRKGFFKAVVSLALPSGKVYSAKGEVEGIIAKEPYLKFLKGYPFRSFFFLPKIGKYYHEDELTKEEEKIYNHRHKAVQKLKPIIKDVILSEAKNL